MYHRFRQRALEEDINVGRAITEAMKFWMKERDKMKKRNIKALLKINGLVKAKHTVRWSKDIDKILYG